jgi:hypothetical protein
VKKLVESGTADRSVGKEVAVEGEMILITRPDEKTLRFDVPGMRRAFVIMSGRLYERQYEEMAEKEEAAGTKEKKELRAQTGPGAKSEAGEQAKEAASTGATDKPDKPKSVETGQRLVQQLNYEGETEQVDTALYRNKLMCKCGNVRWVKNADMFQVKKCKPCTVSERKARRRKGGKQG